MCVPDNIPSSCYRPDHTMALVTCTLLMELDVTPLWSADLPQMKAVRSLCCVQLWFRSPAVPTSTLPPPAATHIHNTNHHINTMACILTVLIYLLDCCFLCFV